ncbi:MAG: hypothetical protein ACRDQ2_11305 [Gaiellales bacterium]
MDEAEGFVVALVREEVGADESAVLASEEGLGRPAGKGRYEGHGLPGGRCLRRPVAASGGPREPPKPKQRLDEAMDEVRHCRQLRRFGGQAPGLSRAVAGVFCARPVCDLAV